MVLEIEGPIIVDNSSWSRWRAACSASAAVAVS
jgi:hypothetical protein